MARVIRGRSTPPLPWLAVVLASLASLAGCASGPERASPGVVKAECPVCRVNADLACLEVKVSEATPHSEAGGRTYYFCSAGCKADFDRNPSKYIRR